MNEPSVEHEPIVLKPWYRRQLTLFISGSIIIALALISISLMLYVSSGASLLDVSRPGYINVQDEVTQVDTFQAFSSDGSVTKDSLSKFQELYDKQVKSVTNPTVFDATPLSDQSLGIEDPGAAE